MILRFSALLTCETIVERPDQAKFEMFIAPLVKYDAIWQDFADCNHYTLELNSLRKPGRLLRRNFSYGMFRITYLIELYMESIWYKTDFTNDLPYTIVVCAFIDEPGKPEIRWRHAKNIIAGVALEEIGTQLSGYLNQAFNIISEWTPEYVKKYGKTLEWTEHGWVLQPRPHDR